LSALHETAHGLTCKHYGARVPAMGFALVYLAPAFYTDVTEGVVRGTQFQRLIITVAGVWSEMGVCAIATPLWWGTAPGTAIHDFAYTVILITGIAVVLLNWNPLLKLDGYYILSDLLNIADLKENSTAYVAAWVKKHIWRLPVEVPFVPRRRRLGFAFYAITSGLYSYTVLYVVARFVGNVFRNFSPEWSFIPELATAGLIFRSRIRTLVNFMKFFYLDKKDRVRAWFTTGRSWGLATTLLIFLLLPLWHESIRGRFVLEPAERAVIRPLVPGTVTAAYAEEGQPVAAGALLVRLRNLEIDSQLARSQADYAMAASRANSALLRNVEFGPASQERQRLREQTSQLATEASQLDLRSPIAGVVLTPRVGDRVGAYVAAGTELVDVANVSSMRARIYVSEYDMYSYHPAFGALLQIDGIFGKRHSTPERVAPVSSEVAPGLVDLTKYTGLQPPKFYVVDLLVPNGDGKLKPGMIGTARIYGRRRSLVALGWDGVTNLVERKIW
jgi:putative peptide zinc metalloprotease protein